MNKTKQKVIATGTVKPEVEVILELPKPENQKKVSKKGLVEKSSASIKANKVDEPIESVEKTADKKIKVIKPKVIRDSFSFPEQDYQKISELKKVCLAAGIHVKKGEILRAGLNLLTQLKLSELKKAIAQVEKVQTGRPSGS
jgi:hypothetical protein